MKTPTRGSLNIPYTDTAALKFLSDRLGKAIEKSDLEKIGYGCYLAVGWVMVITRVDYNSPGSSAVVSYTTKQTRANIQKNDNH